MVDNVLVRCQRRSGVWPTPLPPTVAALMLRFRASAVSSTALVDRSDSRDLPYDVVRCLVERPTAAHTTLPILARPTQLTESRAARLNLVARLPDELVVAVLARLGRLWLHAATLVSRSWRRLILDYGVGRSARLRVKGLLPCASLMNRAAAGGHVRVMLWLRFDLGLPLSAGAVARLIAVGHLHALRDLRRVYRAAQRTIPWPCNACEVAASHGHTDVLAWLRRAARLPWCEIVYCAAARIGNIDVMARALDDGCPWSSLAYAPAIASRRIDAVRWLIARGCPFDSFLAPLAALVGDSSIFVALTDAGCPWHPSVCADAARLACNNNSNTGIEKTIECVAARRGACTGAPEQRVCGTPDLLCGSDSVPIRAWMYAYCQWVADSRGQAWASRMPSVSATPLASMSSMFANDIRPAVLLASARAGSETNTEPSARGNDGTVC